MPEPKEWFKVTHGPTGTTVSCTRQEGALTVKWTVKTFASQIRAGAKEARAGAKKALAELKMEVLD